MNNDDHNVISEESEEEKEINNMIDELQRDFNEEILPEGEQLVTKENNQ